MCPFSFVAATIFPGLDAVSRKRSVKDISFVTTTLRTGPCLYAVATKEAVDETRLIRGDHLVILDHLQSPISVCFAVFAWTKPANAGKRRVPNPAVGGLISYPKSIPYQSVQCE